MTFTVAQRIKAHLVSSGYNTADRINRERLFGSMEEEISDREWSETGRKFTSWNSFAADFFISDPKDDGAVVRYFGSIHKESERLRVYRLILENCSLAVIEEPDPDRAGRKLLHVKESG